MIGIFDSGVGGFSAYWTVRRMLPRENILYLADRKNAPYGTKSKDEILSFTKNNIKRLSAMGAERILIACCTASSLHNLLSEEEREISTPIITPAARLAAKVGEKITVIATNYTVESGAFGKEIRKFADRQVYEIAAQELVSLVEHGNRDGRLSPEGEAYLLSLGQRIRETEADTLILGCTHFSHLEGELKRLLPKVKIISPAREGAMEIVKKINPKHREGGVVTYM